MKLRWQLVIGCCLLTPALGCSGSDTGGAVERSQGTTPQSRTDTDDPEVTTTVDKSPFCVAIRALEGLGTAAPEEPTQARVLEQNTELAQLVEDAANNAPADAPSDVVEMLNDYRTFTQAVAKAAGDVTAALASLDETTPGFMDRLNDHREAFDFFARRCGTTPPA